MSDIYATPEADLAQDNLGNRVGGTIDDAVAGNFEVNMLETLGEAWRGLKGYKLKCHIALALYFLVYIGAFLLAGALVVGLAATGADQSVVGILSFVMQMAIIAVMLPMGVAVLIMALRHAHQKSVSAGEIFRHFGTTLTLVWCYFLQIIMIMIGLVLLVLPGIYLMFAYMFAMPLIVEKKMGAWHALETSRKAVHKVWFRFFGLLWLISLINLLGVLTLGIAWIWTIPWSVLAIAMVYEKIFGIEAQTLAD